MAPTSPASQNLQGIAKLEAIWRSLRRSEVFPVGWQSMLRLLAPRNFLIDPGGLRRIIEERLPYRELEQAVIPLHVVATDLIAGTSVRLSKGPVLEALLASCAIPAAFPSARIGERHLIDGAVASSTPISMAVELGAKRLIVLPTGFAGAGARSRRVARPRACRRVRLPGALRVKGTPC